MGGTFPKGKEVGEHFLKRGTKHDHPTPSVGRYVRILEGHAYRGCYHTLKGEIEN